MVLEFGFNINQGCSGVGTALPHRFSLVTLYPAQSWAQFCCKMWRGQLGAKPVYSSCRCRSEVL